MVADIFGRSIVFSKIVNKNFNPDHVVLTHNDYTYILQTTRESLKNIPDNFSAGINYTFTNDISIKIDKEISKKQTLVFSEYFSLITDHLNLTIWYSSDL